MLQLGWQWGCPEGLGGRKESLTPSSDLAKWTANSCPGTGSGTPGLRKGYPNTGLAGPSPLLPLWAVLTVNQ